MVTFVLQSKHLLKTNYKVITHVPIKDTCCTTTAENLVVVLTGKLVLPGRKLLQSNQTCSDNDSRSIQTAIKITLSPLASVTQSCPIGIKEEGKSISFSAQQ